MANDLVVYTIVHQPRRLKIPAQPIPRGADKEEIEHCIFQPEVDLKYLNRISDKCYLPAADMFLDMCRTHDFKLSIGFSVSFLEQARRFRPDVLKKFKELVAHPNVELIGVEPYHSFLFYLDIDHFIERMRWMKGYMLELFGVEPVISDTTEMCMSDMICHAVEKAGFKAGVLDGRNWVMEWRDPLYLYHCDGDMKLFTRTYELSDDVGYRFSNKQWSGWPLMAETYAHWLRQSRGDFVTLAWDYETFGEHHWDDTGIFWFMKQLPWELKQRGMGFLTMSEALEKYSDRSHHLPLPVYPTTWAGSGGMEFFLGNVAQQSIFGLMHQVYQKAKLTENPDYMDIAMWLLQSDNLHLIQWYNRSGAEAEVSAYFTPEEWWWLEPDRIIWELQAVYQNVVRAMTL